MALEGQQRGRLRRLGWIAAGAGAWVAIATVLALGEASGDPTGALQALDPLERAHAVAALGDARVLAELAGSSGPSGAADAQRVLAAIRSAPFLAEPSLALPALIAAMEGRDPDLAPAAAVSVVAIARRLVEDDHVAEATSIEELLGHEKALAAVEQRARVRADIKLAAVEAAALLSAARERL